MKYLAMAAATLGLATGTAHAGGLDRSYTPIDVLFEDGNYAELSFGAAFPDVTGSDFLGVPYSNVGNDFYVAGGAIKLKMGERTDIAFIVDQPYGSDVSYAGAPLATLLGGTSAKADTLALTALLKYNINDRFSVYGGPRIVKADGQITLSGLAYGPLNGYTVNMDQDHGFGYVVGAAYEIPDIAFRAALTYHSEVDLEMRATEFYPAAIPLGTVQLGNLNTSTPQSVELALQSGIAANTLLFGSVRWSEWSAFTLVPPSTGLAPPLGIPGNLAQLDDAITYEIGVGRQFTEQFSASFAVSYEDGGSDDLVSPLSPTNGRTAVTIGGKYKINDQVTLSGGVRYTWLGDALPETGTPDTPRGTFNDNDAISVGLKLGYHF